MIELFTGLKLSARWKDGTEKVILDYLDYMENLSAVPFHSLAEEQLTIPQIIQDLSAETIGYTERAGDFSCQATIILTAAFLIKQAMKKYKPLQILEIGYTQTHLSFFLMKTAAKFHEKSRLFCLSDLLYENSWMEKMLQLNEGMSQVNILTTSIDSDVLRDSNFDFVVVNGAEILEKPNSVILNAIDFAALNGQLICITEGQQGLEHSINRYIKDAEVYEITGNKKILIKTITQEDKKAILPEIPREIIHTKQQELMECFDSLLPQLRDLKALPGESLKTIITNINLLEDITIELFEVRDVGQLKFAFNEVKEQVLNYMFAKTNDQKEYFQSQCYKSAQEIYTASIFRERGL